MQFPSTLLFAAGALCCLATAINGQDPQDPLVPFNDLLPPLLDAAAVGGSDAKTATAAAKTAPATTRKPTTAPHAILFKPTKKSYYQQQTQHIKELHLIDEDVVVPHDYSEQEEHLQHLHQTQAGQQRQVVAQKIQQQRAQQRQLEKKLQQQQKLQKPLAAKAEVVPLNLELEAPPVSPQATAGSAATSQTAAQLQTAKSFATQPHVPKPAIAVQHVPKPATPVQHVPKPKTVTPHAATPFQHVSKPLAAQQHVYKPTQHRFQAPQRQLPSGNIQQYLDYLQYTTHRPPKAGLPTLTPFPRHLK